jgi:glucose/mannose-6-phosphate isomerase
VTVVLDTLGMFDAAAALPEQVAVAAASTSAVLDDTALPAHDDIQNVVIVGMGGSGIAGDVAREVAGPLMAVPVHVHKGYGVPNFVDDSTLLVAVSFSGDTEETLESVTEAAVDGARIITVSHGGRLAELAAEWGTPHLPIADGIPMPRAALGALAVPPLLLLERIGMFPGGRSWVDAAVEQLHRRRDALIVEGNPAHKLARALGRSFPLVYGGNGMGGLAAMRWKTQFNENAKVPAFCNQLPEATHNELAGWGQDGDVTRQVFQLILLRHDFEHPQVMRRFDLVDEYLDEVVGAVHTVRAEGEGLLAQLFDLALFGDMTSLHAAAEQDVDPGPIPVLDDIKRRVADPG